MGVAKNNDHISKVAADNGLQSWKTVWDENSDLHRATPNQLFKGNRLDGTGGDRIKIPPKGKEKDSGSTGAFNKFKVPTAELFIRIRILKDDYTAAADVPYELLIPEMPPAKGKTDSNGHIKAPIAKTTTAGTLTIRVKKEAAQTTSPGAAPSEAGTLDSDVPIVWNLRIGALNPISEDAPDQYCVSGVQQRLNNINLNTGPIDGINGANTTAAITTFQDLAAISDKVAKPGVSDKAMTQAKLQKVHDGPTPVKPADA